MNVGLYFGSFNPIHNGHLIIASHILAESMLDEIWFVLSPQNPEKINHRMLNENHRLHLLRLAIEDERRFRASNIEFGLPKPSYTANTLIHLQEKYPKNHFSIIMGSDSYNNISNWKNASFIINNFSIFVYNRLEHPLYTTNKNVIKINAPFLDISASLIRKKIKDNKSIRYLVPDAVLEEIEKNAYYKNSLENPTN